MRRGGHAREGCDALVSLWLDHLDVQPRVGMAVVALPML